jgi:hypothetical protein
MGRVECFTFCKVRDGGKDSRLVLWDTERWCSSLHYYVSVVS